jgi:hypothetical protein
MSAEALSPEAETILAGLPRWPDSVQQIELPPGCGEVLESLRATGLMDYGYKHIRGPYHYSRNNAADTLFATLTTERNRLADELEGVLADTGLATAHSTKHALDFISEAVVELARRLRTDERTEA